MTKGIKHKVEKPKTEDGDLIDKLQAHGERGDDRISRDREAHVFEDGFDRIPLGRNAHEVDDGDDRITRLRGSSYEAEG